MAIFAKAFALLALLLAALLASPKLQSLLVFLHWLNWPPFSWSDPSEASPRWAHILGNVLGNLWKDDFFAFEDLADAAPFTVDGPHGPLRGWRLPRRQLADGTSGDCVVLYFHGNAYNIAVEHRTRLYRRLVVPPLACDVVTFDYAGFGHSARRIWLDERGVVEDALAVLGALPDPAAKVVVWGHSLGSGVGTAAMASLIDRGATLPRGFVLENPFTAVPDVPASNFAWLPESWWRPIRSLLHRQMDVRLNSLERIAGVAAKMELFILHGLLDDVIPHSHGEQLAARGGVPLHSFPRSYHRDVPADPSLLDVLVPLFRSWGFHMGEHRFAATG